MSWLLAFLNRPRSNPAVDRRAGAIGHGGGPQATMDPRGICVSHLSWIGGSLPFGTTCTLRKIN